MWVDDVSPGRECGVVCGGGGVVVVGGGGGVRREVFGLAFIFVLSRLYFYLCV